MSDVVLEEEALEKQGEHPDGEESFAELFESYAEGMNEDIRVGDKVKGAIISIGSDSVFVDTRTRIDGFVEKAELLDEEGRFPFKEGDILELYAIAVTGTEIRLSRAISGIGGAELLRDAFENGIPVEGRVKALNKGGFQVEVAQRRAFCPINQMNLKYVENPEEYVNQTYEFLITEFDEDDRNIVLSRRKLLNQAVEKARISFYADLKVGDVMEGLVTKLMPFGAFVELEPGIEGLVHISEMSYTRRILRPEEVVSPGDRVQVMIKEIDKADRRISLSIRDVEGDPWRDVEERFRVGQSLKGTVEKREKFGIFVSLEPGVTGLLPKSTLRESSNGGAIEKMRPGEPITVVIQRVSAGERKISLSPGDEGDAGDWRSFMSGRGAAVSSLGEKFKEALQSKKQRDK